MQNPVKVALGWVGRHLFAELLAELKRLAEERLNRGPRT
jgi:hypothetical protein